MDEQQPNAEVAFTNVFKGLTNCDAICYANSTMQILLDVTEIRELINRLRLDDPLRSFAQKYFAAGNTRIRPITYYINMGLVLNPGEQDDIVSFMERLIDKYPSMKHIFGIKETVMQHIGPVTEWRPCLTIERKDTIQIGVDEATKPDELPDVINIHIDRHELNDDGVSVFTKKAISINKSISIGSKHYKLKGVVIHSGSETSGHFRCIIIRERYRRKLNKIYFFECVCLSVTF